MSHVTASARARGRPGRHRASLRGVLAIALAGLVTMVAGMHPASAKSPGRVYCYHHVCHRVRALAEVDQLVGDIRHESASYYGRAGRRATPRGPRTSSGEPFDATTSQRVASSIYPDGTELLIWNPRNGHTAHVRVNDLGPFHGARTLDLTHQLAEDLDITQAGVATLRVFVISAPLPAETKANRSRVYAATAGYLGTLDEARVGELADDLVDAALQQRLPASETREVATTETETAAAAANPAALAGVSAAVAAPAAFIAEREAAHPVSVAAAAAPVTEAPSSVKSGAAVLAASDEVARSSRWAGRDDTNAPAPTPVKYVASGASRDVPAEEPAARQTATAAMPLVFLVLALTLMTLVLRQIGRAPLPLAQLSPALPRLATAELPTRRDLAEAVVLRRIAGEGNGGPGARLGAEETAALRLCTLRYAMHLSGGGAYSEAESVLRRLLADMEAELGPCDAALAGPLRVWGNCVRDDGRHDDATQIYARAQQLAEQACAPGRREPAAILAARAQLQLDRDDAAAALSDASQAAALATGEDNDTAASALLLVAEAADGLGRPADMESALDRLLAAFDPQTCLAAAKALVLKANLLAARGETRAASELLASAIVALDGHLALGGGRSRMDIEALNDPRRIDGAIAARHAAVELLGLLVPDHVLLLRRLATLID